MTYHDVSEITEAAGKIKSLRLVRNWDPGCSTATPTNVDYRMGKLVEAGILRGTWLDYGCADGSYTVALVRKGASGAVGFDVLHDRIALAEKRYHDIPNVQFLCSSDGTVSVPDNYFDGIFMNEVMEHVTDESKTLSEFRRILRPGGHLVVISPNRWFPFECHGARVGKFNLGFPVPVLPWLPEAVGQRFMVARNYWPSELAHLVRDFGFRLLSVGFVWPVLEVHAWLPSPLIRLYQKRVTTFDKLPFIRRFGVSTVVIATKT